MAQRMFTPDEQKQIDSGWENLINQIKCIDPERVNADGSIWMGVEDLTKQDFIDDIELDLQPE